jgi:hypothetical protein
LFHLRLRVLARELGADVVECDRLVHAHLDFFERPGASARVHVDFRAALHQRDVHRLRHQIRPGPHFDVGGRQQSEEYEKEEHAAESHENHHADARDGENAHGLQARPPLLPPEAR